MKLEAQYVAIRHVEESDAMPLFDHYLGDEKACLYLNRQAHLSSTQTLQAITRWRSQYELAHPNILVLAIEEIASQVPIGCLVLIPEKSSSEIHFCISRNYQGKGYATQACMLGIKSVAIHILPFQRNEKCWFACVQRHYDKQRRLRDHEMTEDRR